MQVKGLLGILMAVAATFLFLPSVRADHLLSSEYLIQPGASIRTETGQCTLNWVYDGMRRHKGEVFVGTAAHCVERVGQPVILQTGTDGTEVLEIGRVAFISENHDYCLIRVDKRKRSLVDPGMKGHPAIPTGVSTTDTAAVGHLVQFSGNGVGFHAHESTRQERRGLLHTVSTEWWSAAGAVTFGDSGGPAANLADGNKALGVVAVVCAGAGCTGAGGITVEGLLSDAAAYGFKVRLRTV
jgi:hypothetical protein